MTATERKNHQDIINLYYKYLQDYRHKAFIITFHDKNENPTMAYKVKYYNENYFILTNTENCSSISFYKMHLTTLLMHWLQTEHISLQLIDD